MKHPLFLKILFVTIVFFTAQITTPVSAQNLFGFKYIFRIALYQSKYHLDADAYKCPDTSFHINNYTLLKTGNVKRGTTLVPGFTMGTTTNGNFTALITKSVEHNHINGNTVNIITIIPAVDGNAATNTTTNRIVTVNTPVGSQYGNPPPAPQPDGSALTKTNNGILQTTTTSRTSVSAANALPPSLTGTFTTVTNGVSTTGRGNGTVITNGVTAPANFTIITPYHGIFTFIDPASAPLRANCSYTDTGFNGTLNKGIFIDTTIVSATDTIYYSGTFTATINRYSSDYTAAAHYVDELFFHPYVFRKADGSPLANNPEFAPGAVNNSQRIQDRLDNYPNRYNIVFTMNYKNDNDEFRVPYSSMPFFDLHFRSGYVGAITIPIGYTIGGTNNGGWSSGSSFLSTGLSVGKIWGYTTFYKDENITPINWYSGVGLFTTLLPVNITPPDGIAPSGTFATNIASMFGINYILHFYGVDVIVAVGTELAIGPYSSDLTTKGHTFIGAGLGFNVLKLVAPNGAN